MLKAKSHKSLCGRRLNLVIDENFHSRDVDDERLL